jgi:DNA topoisomerase-2
MDKKSNSKLVKSDAEKYDKKTPREHVLIRPDTYIGDIEPTSEELWVYVDDQKCMKKQKITYTPGFMKVFDELLVNARDASINDPTCDTIKVDYNIEQGYISVFNNGDIGIPVEEHPVHKILVPTMIFGELLTSSNYDDTDERTTGGRNGLGSKCLSVDTPIPCWNGEIKLAEKIKIGDELIGDDGTVRIVTNLVTGKGKLYEIIQSKGESYKVNDQHILTLHVPDHKVMNSTKCGWSVLWWDNNKKQICNKTGTKQELDDLCESIDNNNVIDIAISDYLNLDTFTKSKLHGIRSGCVQWSNQNSVNNLYNFEQFIVNNSIPKEHIVTDSATRFKLFDYIINYIGNYVDQEHVTLTLNSNLTGLMNDIILLARSLGLYCDKTKHNTNTIQVCIHIKMTQDHDNGFIKVDDIGDGTYVGIEIDGNQRFVINDFTVTHNCSNIFASKFIVEIDDAKRNKRYKQTWTDNMLNVSKAEITKLPAKTKSSVKITFYPDFARFGIKDLDNDHKMLFHRRTIDIAGTALNKLKVYFNDEKITCDNFKSYIELYYPTDANELYFDVSGTRWSIGVFYKPDNGGEVVSFVNSINTYRGGTHCVHVIDNLIKVLINDYIKKKDKDIKVTPTLLKDNLIFFINSVIINPAFASQTKDTLTSKVDKFGSKYEPTPAFLKKLAKCGIVEQVIELAKFKENAGLKKTDGKKQIKIIGIPKLDDANKAGTKESSKCTLILTEGDSAKATAMAGLGMVGRDYWGVFPLKGKILNVREANASQLLANEEIKNLKIIMGLKQGEDYTSNEKFNTLRYGHVLLLTDQDVDGSHIKGLFINMLHTLWPSLIKRENFVQSLNTPIVKATKGKETISFYNLTDYDNWKNSDEHANNYKTKYYKGLGTSTSIEAREYFDDIDSKIISYLWENGDKDVEAKFSDSNKSPPPVEESDNDTDDDDADVFIPKRNDDDAIRLAFDKSRADDRKAWLMNYDKNKVLTYEQKIIPYYDFIHSDLIHFSSEDNNRSIPSVIDGFKPSQRKILYGAFLRGLDKDEVKVAQLAGFVSDRAAYHHGEVSLSGAIVGMAQDFVGSNNINVLVPEGQFGTRLKGGKDFASPRYIHTRLTNLTQLIYNPNDTPLLKQQDDDGVPIEPEYYAPIIPMILVNGTDGIGTGFSTKVPPYNPLEIINNIRNIMAGNQFEPMDPWWQGFNGIVSKVDDFNYEIYGTWTINNNKLLITELPVGEWSSNYKEFLEKMLEDAPLRGKVDDKKGAKKLAKKTDKPNPFLEYKDANTDTRVSFELTFEDGYLDTAKDIDKLFHLYKKYSITNMHLHGPDGHIKRYDNVEEIMQDYYHVRLDLYQKRKVHQLGVLEQQLKIISWKTKFILMVVEKKLEINNKKKQEIEDKLAQHKFPKLGKSKDDKESYDYLLSMPIYNLTQEKIEDLKKNQADKEAEYNTLNGKTPETIWSEELDVFEAAYNKWCQDKLDASKLIVKKVKKVKKVKNM